MNNKITDVTDILFKSLADMLKASLVNQLTKIGLPPSYAHITENVYSTYANRRLQLFIANYWMYIESGRKPGKMPPISAIVAWIMDVKKKIKLRDKKGKFIKKSPINVSRVAFLIARAIGRRGIKPRPFIFQVADQAFEYFSNQIDEVIIKNLMDNMIVTEMKLKKK